MLSYLAGGFDWQSDYVMTLRRDDCANLFAWVTLASSDFTSFPDAATAVVPASTRGAMAVWRSDAGPRTRITATLGQFRLTVSNSGRRAIAYEARFRHGDVDRTSGDAA